MADADEIPLHTVTLTLCEPCLTGEGGECHSPGCALWMNRAPDIPVTQHLGEAEAQAAHDAWQAAMPDASPVLAAAVTERDHIAALLAEHEATCNDPWCPDCTSLGKHLKRAQAQVDMLTPAETEAMFDG